MGISHGGCMDLHVWGLYGIHSGSKVGFAGHLKLFLIYRLMLIMEFDFPIHLNAFKFFQISFEFTKFKLLIGISKIGAYHICAEFHYNSTTKMYFPETVFPKVGRIASCGFGQIAIIMSNEPRQTQSFPD